jgi:hypothetical protein
MNAPTSDTDRLASLPKPSPSSEGRIWLRDLPLPANTAKDLYFTWTKPYRLLQAKVEQSLHEGDG